MWHGIANENAPCIRICKTSDKPKIEIELKTQPDRKSCPRTAILSSQFELYLVVVAKCFSTCIVNRSFPLSFKFHVAVRLVSNWSQMGSRCTEWELKKGQAKRQPRVPSYFLSTFWSLLWSVTEGITEQDTFVNQR